MRIISDTQIAGFPIKRVRDAIRPLPPGFTRQHFCSRFDFEEVDHLLATLLEEGYFEHSAQVENGFNFTTQGCALSNASLLKPISRNKASVLLNQLLDRANAINESSNYLLWVTDIGVFGSYARDEQDCGDIDIVYRMMRRPTENGSSDWLTVAKAHFRSCGRRENNWDDYLHWPELQVAMALKARSPYISLHRTHGLPPGVIPMAAYEFDTGSKTHRRFENLDQPFRESKELD